MVFEIKLANIRDGIVSDITAIMRVSSIPAERFFVYVPIEAAGARDAWKVLESNVAGYIDANVRSTYAYVHALKTTELLAEVNAAAVAAGKDVNAARNAWVMPEDVEKSLRAYSVICGSIRAAAVVGLRLTTADLKPNESVAAAMKVVVSDAAEETIAATPGAARTAAEQDLLDTAVAFPDMTGAEQEIATFAAMIATGVAVQVGAILVETTHHYLSNASGAKRIDATAGQVYQKMAKPEAERVKVAMDTDAAKDIAYHTSFHPVVEGVLIALAKDKATAARLLAANLGAAAVGIPAERVEVQRMRAFAALNKAFGAGAAQYGSFISFAEVDAALAAYDSPASTDASRDGLVAGTFPKIVSDMAPGVAFLGGYGTAAVGDMEARDAARITQLNSYAVKNTMAENVQMYLSGAAFYAAAAKYARTRAAEGDIPVTVFALDSAKEAELLARATAMATERRKTVMTDAAIRAGTMKPSEMSSMISGASSVVSARGIASEAVAAPAAP